MVVFVEANFFQVGLLFAFIFLSKNVLLLLEIHI